MRNKKLIILLSVVVSLVLVIIVCGATFLVRDVRAYNYYSVSEDRDEQVIAAAGIKMHSSIFFLDEPAIKTRIETAYSDIGVVNIERRFPDVVSINYVVYEPSFQYLNGSEYYQCYSSGRIGSTSTTPMGGYFTVRPKATTSTSVGGYFQNDDGYDRKLITQFVTYLKGTGLNDRQIAERISFVDITRAGHFYIRTVAGCSIEIKGVGSEFNSLLDGAWSIFVDPSPSIPIVKSSGIIRAYESYLDGNTENRYTYDPTYGEEEYRSKYLGA